MWNKCLEWFKKRNEEVSPVSSWVNLLIAVIVALVGIHFYVKDRVKEFMTSPEMIELVSSKIRPVVIFDSEKTIISGKSAMKYFLDDFDIKRNPKSGEIEITITTKDLLSTSPILESLDANFRIDVRKGERFKWIYTLKPIIALVVEDSALPRENLRFKLEFLE